MRKNTPSILITGANGMLGKMVYYFLKTKYPKTVWGSVKENPTPKENLLLFRSGSFKKDFKYVSKSIGKIDYIINCAAILKESKNTIQIDETNSFFPNLLEKASTI